MTRSEYEGPPHALVVGATGIAGAALVAHLRDQEWTVSGLSRGAAPAGAVTHIKADLHDPHQLAAAVRTIRPTHVFYTSWARRDTERENCAVNGVMVRNLLDALRPA